MILKLMNNYVKLIYILRSTEHLDFNLFIITLKFDEVIEFECVSDGVLVVCLPR